MTSLYFSLISAFDFRFFILIMIGILLKIQYGQVRFQNFPGLSHLVTFAFRGARLQRNDLWNQWMFIDAMAAFHSIFEPQVFKQSAHVMIRNIGIRAATKNSLQRFSW